MKWEMKEDGDRVVNSKKVVQGNKSEGVRDEMDRG